jgi:hypothetical protein
LHSFRDLTKHIKTRIDDSHAPPAFSFSWRFLTINKKTLYFYIWNWTLLLVRSSALHQIKSYDPQLERFTVNSLDFRLCNITCQVEGLGVSFRSPVKKIQPSAFRVWTIGVTNPIWNPHFSTLESIIYGSKLSPTVISSISTNFTFT